MAEEIQSIESEIKAAKSRAQDAGENLQRKEQEAEEFDDDKFDDKIAEVDRKIEQRNNEGQAARNKLEKLENKKVSVDEKVTEAKQLFNERNETVKIMAGDIIETNRNSREIDKEIKTHQEGELGRFFFFTANLQNGHYCEKNYCWGSPIINCSKYGKIW